jgi:hypothetical protein
VVVSSTPTRTAVKNTALLEFVELGHHHPGENQRGLIAEKLSQLLLDIPSHLPMRWVICDSKNCLDEHLVRNVLTLECFSLRMMLYARAPCSRHINSS